MTLTIDISPETGAWLEEEATKRGQSQGQVAKLALEALSSQRSQKTEEALAADWQALSYRSLWEIWDNDEDAVYDRL